MDTSTSVPLSDTSFELYFRSLYNGGRGLAFPCDAEGHVDLDTLPEAVRNNYFYAHALMGRDFAWSVMRPHWTATVA